MDTYTNEYKANKLMKESLDLMQESTKSRELAIAITNLEQAMMWNNKARTVNGELKPYNN